jgi:UDP-glucuronate 4-epimerase
MKILVTGVAGFIGFHVAKRLLDQDVIVVGIDNLNDYYDVALKQARLNELQSHAKAANFKFIKLDISDQMQLQQVFRDHNFVQVIHLAAQAGVRYSMTNPYAYVQSNLVGFVNILENCRHNQIKHLVYASSSSVYGLNSALPFSEHVAADHQMSFYGATKRANELMAHSYSSLYNLPTTGLRFFTVYGPWGRPDMALFKFTEAIMAGKTIDVFNHGEHYRDFTYVDDIVTGILKVAAQPAMPNPYFDASNPDPATSSAPWRVFNIGNNSPVKLTAYIKLIEKYLNKTADIKLLPLQPGDVPDTYADVTNLEQAVGYRPTTSIETGVKEFLNWYLEYYPSKATV